MFNFEEGEVLLVDKPYEWTSFQVVNKLRYKIKRRLQVKKIKVGHAGTLDPLATGLLIICTGKMTKSINDYMGQDKVYEGKLVLGKTTPSIDLETDFDNDDLPYDHITKEDIDEAASKLSGEIAQIPPVFSAVSVDGVRAYKKARKGEEVEIKARNVTVHEFIITNINFPEISFRIKCSKGTYIRSLVRDFGELLNSGAYLSSLKRIKIGNFDVKDAYELTHLVQQIES